MAGTVAARRYAQAMFELAREWQQADPWQADISVLAAATADEMILAVLESPRISRDDKARLLGDAAPQIAPLVMNMVKLLISRSEIGILPDINEEYGRLLDSSRGIEKGNALTAVPIDEEEQQKLAESIGGLVGKKVELASTIDPDILGGVIARVGGKLLDGSTRSKLAALKRQLASGEKRR